MSTVVVLVVVLCASVWIGRLVSTGLREEVDWLFFWVKSLFQKKTPMQEDHPTLDPVFAHPTY